MLVTSIFSISHNVFKRLLSKVFKSWDSVVKSLISIPYFIQQNFGVDQFESTCK